MDKKTIRILLVEDEAGIARSLTDYFKEFGHFPNEVVWADTLTKAFSLLESNPIDVVLLDLGLPDSEGFETFRRMRERVPGIPIVVSTGLSDETIAVKAVREGAQDYLVKGTADGAAIVRTVLYAVERTPVDAKTRKANGRETYLDVKRSSFPNLPEPLNRLGDLAYNLWFSWHYEAYRLFRHLDIKLWEDAHHNPVQLIKEIDSRRLEELLDENVFMCKYRSVVEAFDHYMNQKDTRFAAKYPDCVDRKVVYFSMEFGIHESLPIYSGGLGILAGDHLKSASDNGVPLVGMGLLYRESYFTQFISLHGNQQSVFEPNNFSNLALQPVPDAGGKHLTIRVRFDHQTVAARVWKAEVGRVNLYLLDTDFSENPTDDRKITERLYVQDRDLRLVQEMLLGVGGVRVLEALGISPAVWHMNEGHCALSGFERMRDMLEKGVPLSDAITRIRPSTVFTTHTPVAAGNEVFETARIDHFLKAYWESLKIPRDDFFRTAQDPQNPDHNAFNMTILSLNTSGYANAVSELHGTVSRRMWHTLWPAMPPEQVPIDYVTNGVHTRTWMSSYIKNVLDEYLGSDWRYHLSEPDYWTSIQKIPDDALWRVHGELKFRLIEYVRRNLLRQRERNGESVESIAEVKRFLHPETLTIGFARRFTPYKRGTLLFRNRDWLKYLLSRGDLPIQIIFAGKAHPADQMGKSLIQTIHAESRSPEFCGKIVFVENYDMSLAKILLSGVDVWLNLPRRPLEASGTSGMKAAANGALNCSVLDGWWRESYDGDNGWAIGEDREYYNEQEQDEQDSQSLYRLLQDEITPMFYRRDANGLPAEWLKKMKRSMQTVIPKFSTCRMLDEYVSKYYVPAMRAKT